MRIIDVITNKSTNSLELSGLTGKPHADVVADISQLFEKLDITIQDLPPGYRAQELSWRQPFSLPRREAVILLCGYGIEIRSEVIDLLLRM